MRFSCLITRSRLPLVLNGVAGLALVVAACGGDDSTLPEGATDAGPSLADGGSARVDSSVATPTDAGGSEPSNPDSGNPDAGNPDSGNPDAGNPDSGNPDASLPPQAPVAQGQTLTTVSNTALSVALQATDADSTTLTYAIVANPTSGTLSGFNAATGLVTYTPNAGFTGADTFTFKANDGALDSATATITVNVSAIPQPIAQGQAATTPEDTAKVITLTSAGAAGPVTYAIKTAPTKGTLSAVAGANVTYTPSANYFGTDSFVFTVSNDGGATSTEATVALTVTSVNDVPLVTAVNKGNVYLGVPVSVTLAGTDVETAAAALTIAVSGATNGTLGAVVNKTVTFTPAALGPASFIYTASDGTATSAAGTVSMTVVAAPSCYALLRAGVTTSGVYSIKPADGYPTLSAYCDMTTDGGGWTRVFNHDRVAGGFFASAADAMLKNDADPNNAIYSVLQHLEGFRANGGFEFRINWPVAPTVRNIWDQTSNPTQAGAVTGYRAVSVGAHWARWGGLERSSGPTLLDGSVNHGDWWYSVGSTTMFGGNGIPASNEVVGGDGSTSHVQLWVRPPSVCGNGIVEARESCDDGNPTNGDGCSSTCAGERTNRATCLAVLTAGESVGDGAYVIDPDGPGGAAPITTYCDMTRDGGGWTLVAKVGQGLFTNLTDPQYLALVANVTTDVDPLSFNDGNYPGYGSMAFFNKANTNALFAAAEGKVVRVDMTSNLGDATADGTYFQKKINPPAGWNFWAGLRDSRLWNDNGAVSGDNVSGFGTQFVLTKTAANYTPATHAVTHSGDGSFGWWDAFTHTLNDASTLSMSRHGGLLCDGTNTGWAWLLTLNSNDARWKNDSGSGAKSRVWLR